jgi:hypothetical protein
MSELKVGFEMKKIRLPLGDILPVRQIGGQERIDRYQTIVNSIKAVGLVEPLMVHPQKGTSGKYLLVDGHLRLNALRELGETEADSTVGGATLASCELTASTRNTIFTDFGSVAGWLDSRLPSNLVPPEPNETPLGAKGDSVPLKRFPD